MSLFNKVKTAAANTAQDWLNYLLNLMTVNFTYMLRRNEPVRLRLWQQLACFYNQEFEKMEQVIQEYFKNKPFSSDTLSKRILYKHEDIIQKLVHRKTAGLFSNLPDITLSDPNKPETVDENLTVALDEFEFFKGVQEAYRRSKYFNTVIVMPLYNAEEDTFRLDIICGDICTVVPKSDYFLIDAMKIIRVNSQFQVYYSVWKEDQHFTEDSGGTPISDPENEDNKNPYKDELGKSVIPAAILRERPGKDFWGEPNWSLFFHQMFHTMKISDNERGEFYQKFAPMIGINAKLSDNTTLDPGSYNNFENNDPQRKVSIESIKMETPWNEIRENAKFNNESFMMTQGIPAGTASLQPARAASGVSKTIDEVELTEQRMEDQNILFDFMIDLLRMIRIVWNYNIGSPNVKGRKALQEKYVFDCHFTEEKPLENVDDKIKRREMEYQYEIKSEIDFIMEDLECDEEEAKTVYEKNLALKKASNPAPDNTSNNPNNPKQQAKPLATLDFLSTIQEKPAADTSGDL